MKSLLTLAAVIAAALAVAGCKSPGIFATSFDDGRKSMVVLDASPIFPVNLAVSELKDLRGGDNTSGAVFWSFCPLMPFGWVDYSRPENAAAMMNIGNYQYDLFSELSRAAAVSFETSRLFNSAYYTANNINDRQGELVLEGEVYSTRFNGKLISYGISIASPALWVIGLPATYLSSSIEMKLRIIHRATGNVIWEQQVQAEDAGWRWAYGRSSEEIGVYCKLVRQELNKAIPALEKLLSENPDLLNGKVAEQPGKADAESEKSKQEQQEVKAAAEAAKTM